MKKQYIWAGCLAFLLTACKDKPEQPKPLRFTMNDLCDSLNTVTNEAN